MPQVLETLSLQPVADPKPVPLALGIVHDVLGEADAVGSDGLDVLDVRVSDAVACWRNLFFFDAGLVLLSSRIGCRKK